MQLLCFRFRKSAIHFNCFICACFFKRAISEQFESSFQSHKMELRNRWKNWAATKCASDYHFSFFINQFILFSSKRDKNRPVFYYNHSSWNGKSFHRVYVGEIWYKSVRLQFSARFNFSFRDQTLGSWMKFFDNVLQEHCMENALQYQFNHQSQKWW